MTRFALPDNDTAAAQPHVSHVFLAELDFSSGFVRVSSRERSFSHEGNTFTGLGHFGGLGPVKENGNLSPDKLEFQLSGVDNSLITTVRTENYHGRDVRLWLGLLDETYQYKATPQLLWEGFMDTMQIHTEMNRSVISLVAENHLILWNEASAWLYTDEHQQLHASGDLFFNQVSTLPNKLIKWGDYSVSTGTRLPGRDPRRGNPRSED